MTPTRDPEVQKLLDKQEIHEVLMRYFRGVDRIDHDLLRATFHEDSFVDYFTFRGTGWELADWMMTLLNERFVATLHFPSTELIEVDGDVARSELYFLAYHHIKREGQEYYMFIAGRYIDTHERRDGVWRIKERLLVHEWSRTAADTPGLPGVPPTLGADPLAHRYQGIRSREDIVYQK